MDKVLVTGGSGFIGTNLISLLISEGYSVLNLDIREPRNIKHMTLWRKVDVLDVTLLLRNFDDFGPDYVVHLAARTDLSSTAVLDDYKVNIEGVRNVLASSIINKNVRRTIIASSMLVCKVGYVPNSFLDYCPTTVYGQSKVLTEKITREFDLDWVLVRPTSIWGPWFGPPYRDFFDLVLRGKYWNLPRSSSAVKTYGYVGNTSLQLFALLVSVNAEVSKNTYYLGDEESINISHWADLIAEFSFRKQPRVLPMLAFKVTAIFGDLLDRLGIDFPLTSFRLKNMTTNNICDIERTNLVLDKSIRTRFSLSLSENIKETLNWINQEK